MLGKDELFESGNVGTRRFHQKQNLSRGFNLSLPTIVRLEFRDEVCAGNQPGVQCGPGQLARRLQVWCRDQNQ